ncbi:MAG: hypothetical protein JRG74_00075 [Deltaproteobacteria bacterium]|nr:hypothetical protein [Deltaproteobacteria bacterium]MBW1833267.1 hypothetical protein [Deltaproteobacteria bacterium]MBW2164535.1 hypothetical protein [Deltaproteobacteria bacterium]
MMEIFKRISFFEGFFTKADDWNAGQKYHIEKRRLHNKSLHIPGVVPNYSGELKVTPAGRFSLYIAPGYAIDGEGRDLFLAEPKQLDIRISDYTLPQTVYITISYDEQKIDKRENVANPTLTGYAFVEEGPKVEVSTQEPDNFLILELARIELAKGVKEIKDAEDSFNPKRNEIDLMNIREAGVVKGPTRLRDLGKVKREGEIRVAKSKEKTPGHEDTSVFLESLPIENAHRYYLVSAYPVTQDTAISWRIESSFSDNQVKYRLFFKNFSNVAAKVSYKVYILEE